MREGSLLPKPKEEGLLKPKSPPEPEEEALESVVAPWEYILGGGAVKVIAGRLGRKLVGVLGRKALKLLSSLGAPAGIIGFEFAKDEWDKERLEIEDDFIRDVVDTLFAGGSFALDYSVIKSGISRIAKKGGKMIGKVFGLGEVGLGAFGGFMTARTLKEWTEKEEILKRKREEGQGKGKEKGKKDQERIEVYFAGKKYRFPISVYRQFLQDMGKLESLGAEVELLQSAYDLIKDMGEEYNRNKEFYDLIFDLKED